jgi:cell division transport system ATP-binding protein
MIELYHVEKAYAAGRPALVDVSLQVDRGEFVFITGPSGAGKTTLFKLLFREELPTHGHILIDGKNLAAMDDHGVAALRRSTGVVFQDFRLLDHLTTFENIALPLRVLGKEEASYRADVVELLRWVGLGDRMHALPPVLSGGEKQRAAIARALIGKPEVLLADEPTGNVDPPLARRLMRLFVELNRLGTSVVIATHDINLMNQFNARRLVLEEGRLTVYD